MQVQDAFMEANEQVPLLIFASEMAAIEAEALAWPNLETGGELFGYFTHAQWPVVHLVLNAGAGARRNVVTFHPDAEEISREGGQLINRYGLQHIGQWHSHHRMALTHPSGVDCATITNAVRGNGLNSFVQVIANLRRPSGQTRVLAHAYRYTSDQPGQYMPMSWLVLPGISPVRQQSQPSATMDHAVQLPLRTTWDQLRHQRYREEAVESPRLPRTPLFARLGNELRSLHQAGILAKARPVAEGLHIHATADGRRFIVRLASDFPDSPPILYRLFDDAPNVEVCLPWSPDQSIADLLIRTNAPCEGSEPAPDEVDRARAGLLDLLQRKRRQLGGALVHLCRPRS